MMPPSPIPNLHQTRLKSIQVLRGLAALIVVLFHANETILHYQWKPSYLYAMTKWGALGVDLLFVISGFVMIATTRNRGAGFDVGKAFIRDRLIRIVPLYWMLTTGMVMLLLILPSAFNQIKFDSIRVLTSGLNYEQRTNGVQQLNEDNPAILPLIKT